MNDWKNEEKQVEWKIRVTDSTGSQDVRTAILCQTPIGMLSDLAKWKTDNLKDDERVIAFWRD